MAAIKLKVGDKVRLYRRDGYINFIDDVGTVYEIRPSTLNDYGWVRVDFGKSHGHHWVSVYCLAHA